MPCAFGTLEPLLNPSLHFVITVCRWKEGREWSSGQAEGTRSPILEAGTGPAAAAWFLESLRAEARALASQCAKLSHCPHMASKKTSGEEKRDFLGVAMLGRREDKGS